MQRDFKSFFRDEYFYGAVGMHNLLCELSSETYDAASVAGYHVLLTKPFFYNCLDADFKLHEFELVTAELSARLWKRYNGPIYLITDEIGYQYIMKTELFKAYDEILPILSGRNFGIDSHKYWASGKIQALMRISAPCAVIDMDLMIWRPLKLKNYPLVVAHTEHLVEYIYPSLDFFHMDNEYYFPNKWDKKVEPLNTSIVYFKDEAFKKYYASESIRFMQSEKETPDNGTICMVFAEQRILAMCAAEKKVPVHTLLNYDNLCDDQNLITHIWSAKEKLHSIHELEKIYNALCRKKIEQLKRT